MEIKNKIYDVDKKRAIRIYDIEKYDSKSKKYKIMKQNSSFEEEKEALQTFWRLIDDNPKAKFRIRRSYEIVKVVDLIESEIAINSHQKDNK